MIDDQRVEKAVNWLAMNGEKAAQARAEREYLTEYRKTLKAKIMREQDDMPLVAQEREAYADKRYVEHLEAMREAIKADELMRWQRVAAETLVSAWQSQQRMINK